MIPHFVSSRYLFEKPRFPRRSFSASQVVNILTLLILIVAIPFTVFIAQQQQTLQGKAATTSLNWINVTPSNASLTQGSCDNYGTTKINTDPNKPSDLYAQFNCQGVWKSIDYGQSWNGPINTGANGATAGDCAGGITLASQGSGKPPIIYQSCIRGAGLGFWRSDDGGVNWTKYSVPPNPYSTAQDVIAPVVDPYDSNHLLMPYHESNGIIQSFDGGQSWSRISEDNGMCSANNCLGTAYIGTGLVYFINTGNPSTTRNTFMWMAEISGGSIGTWRTTNGGASWTRVETNEHPHGAAQIYQPDTSGVLYMAGIYGTQGWGVYRSTNYGQTFTHVGNSGNESSVYGTPNHVYSNYSWACKPCTVDPNFQVAPQPGTSGWTNMPTPSGMNMGPAMVAVTYDGTNYILVGANWNSGLWRYVEPAPGQSPSPQATPSSTPSISPGVSPSPSPFPSPASSIAGLHVSGNRILNNLNQTVSLHGVDVAGASYMCQAPGSNLTFDGPTDQNSINALKTWQINAVRIPISEDCWLGINGEPVSGQTAAQYQAAITNYINLLNSNGIVAIFDLQYSAPGTTIAQNTEPMPDADHSSAFWDSVANTYKNNGSVIFDLFNEPWPDNNSISTAAWICLRDGGTCPGVSYQTVGMQSLVNTVRATGATNILMIPGITYANTLNQWLTYKPNDPLNNLTASWHSYANQYCSAQSCWDSQVAPVMAQVPLIAGEIGENDCQDIYINPLMNWLDSHGGNYLAWAWATYDCSGFPSLISNYSGTPTGFGVGYRDHLLSLAGVPTPSPAPVTYFTTTFPFGINVGSTNKYVASDGTTYYPDVNSPGLLLDKMDANNGNFQPYTTPDTITGTSDPALFQKGRSGRYGFWYINVPNGTYNVTFGMAPTGLYPNPLNAGEFGQDQLLQTQKVAFCAWSSHVGNNTDSSGCPFTATWPPPPKDQAQTLSYNIGVYNQQLAIEVGASFGGGRNTLLDMIKVSLVSSTPTPTITPTPTTVTTATPSPTPIPTSTPTPTPTFTPTPTPTLSSTPSPTPSVINTPTVTPTSGPTPVSLFAVSGTVYNDLNGNGVQDPGEPGVPGVTVHVSGPVFQTTVTGGNGNYGIGNLPSGQYSVVMVVPQGFVATTNPSPVITLSQDTTVNFGIQVVTLSSTPTPTLIQAPLRYNLRLGATSLKTGDSVKLDFTNDTTKVKYTFAPTVTTVPGQPGLYTLTVSGFMPPGSYLVLITARGHLSKKVGLVYPPSDLSLLDLSGSPLVAGDINGDNRINSLDLGKLIEQYQTLGPETDLDGDGIVDAKDAALIFQNYLKQGDQ